MGIAGEIGSLGENALASYVGGVVNIGVKGLVEGLINNIDLKGIETGGAEIIQGLQNNVSKISSTIGGLAGEAVGSLIDGEFSINLLNLADFLAFLPGEQSEGMSDDLFSHLQKIKNNSSMGLFELNIGVRDDKAGVRSRIGSGGASINIMGLIQGFHSLGRLGAINAAAIEAEEEQRLIQELAEEALQNSSTEPELTDPETYPSSNEEPNQREQESNEEPPGESLTSFLGEETGEITEEDVRNLQQQIDNLDDTPVNKLGKLMKAIHGKDFIRKQKAIDLLTQLIGEENVNKASDFMKDMVLEEGLIAYDYMKFALEVIEAGKITKESVKALKMDVEEVADLSDDFYDALSTAIGLQKSELLDAIRLKNNADINAFNETMLDLQERGLINDHMIFNPFDQDNFDANQLAEMAARQRVIEDNALAMSRMIMVKEGDKRYFYIIDNRVEDEWIDDNNENDAGAWDKLDANVYKVEVLQVENKNGDMVYDSIPEGISWSEGALVINQNQFPNLEGLNGRALMDAINNYRENIFNPDNLVGKAGDTYFTNNRDSNAESLGISFENARFAGYAQREYDALMAQISSKAQSFFDENNNLIPSKLFNVGNDKAWAGLVSRYQSLMKDPRYQDLLTLRENDYAVMNSNTWCNVGASGYAYDYYRDGIGFSNQGELTSIVSRSLNPVTDTLGYHNAFVEVSLDYAALWGKTNALSYGRMFGSNGRPGHISMFSDIGPNSGNSKLYSGNDIYEYFFNNIGEWNGYNIPMSRAWGPYVNEETGLRDINRFKHNVEFFVLAPGLR
jgi:hypothetical protein